MSFQASVKRNYTVGFPGEIIKDGPTRAKPARIASVAVGADPGASTNRVSRAFGFTADVGNSGTTQAMLDATVSVGAPVFYGVLGHPKHYALYGSTAGGPLGAAYDLPQGAEGEFFDMAIMVAEVFNETTGIKAIGFGDALAFVPSTITTGNNPNQLPYGALVSYNGSLPTGLVAIPNARVVNNISLAASAPGAAVSGYTIIQLTQ